MKKLILNSIGILVYSAVYILRFFDIYFFRYSNAFGHQTLNVEYYARRVKIISRTDNPTLVGIRHYEKAHTIANDSLFEHHKHSGLNIVSNRMMCFLLDLGLTFQKQKIEKKGGKKSTSFLTSTLEKLDTDSGVHLLSDVAFPFNADEVVVFDEILNKMSLKSGEYYIVLDRGKNYYKSKILIGDSTAGYSYKKQHNLIEMQFKAAKAMKEYNIKAVKMGCEPRKEIIEDGVILDYPSKFRNSIGDIADLALMNGCKFYVGPSSGVYGLAQSLKKPVLLCNVFPWPWHRVPMGGNSIVMPKKIWLIKEKRMMTLCEMIKLENHYSMKDLLYNKAIFDSSSIELISNTEDEIAYGVKEINSRIDGTWDGDNYSLSYILQGYIGEVSQSYLSTSFVENNPDIMTSIYPDK